MVKRFAFKDLLGFLYSKAGVLIVIGATALFLRLYYFMGILRGDDFLYAFYANELLSGQLDTSGAPPGFTRTGLYYPVALVFKLFGASEFSAILFPLASSLLTLFFIYKITKILAGEQASQIAAFLWAIFPLDVFLATQLLPDGPTAMSTSGVIYFLLLAQKGNTLLKRLLAYAVIGFFVIWSFNIKESTLPIVFVMMAIMALGVWQRHKARIHSAISETTLFSKALILMVAVACVIAVGVKVLQNQSASAILNKLELTAFDIAPVWILGRYNPVSHPDIGVGFWIPNSPYHSPLPQSNVLTSAPGGEQFILFYTLIPIFIIAAVYAVLKQKTSMYIPLLWFGILIAYLEWGSYSMALAYTPVIYWTDPRNMSFTAVPMVISVSVYLGEGTWNPRINLSVLVSCLIVILTAIALSTDQLFDIANTYAKAALVFVLGLGITSTFQVFGQRDRQNNHSWVFPALLVAISTSSLLPSTHFHVFDYTKEQERRANILELDSMLSHLAPLPIYAESGVTPWLDLYTDFSYGFNLTSPKVNTQKLTYDFASVEKNGGYLINFGCEQSITGLDSWPLAQVGNLGSSECLTLIRSLPQTNAEVLMHEDKELALLFPTVENINAYLTSAAGASNYEEFIYALSLLVSRFPNQVPISQTTDIFRTFVTENGDHRTRDLLSTGQNGQFAYTWNLGERLTFERMDSGTDSSIKITVDDQTDEPQPIYVDIPLKSSTAYLLEFELRSFAPFDLVQFPDADIPDSYGDSWNRSPDWETFYVSFVTPVWLESEQLITVEIARIFDRGDIQFRLINLIELQPDE